MGNYGFKKLFLEKENLETKYKNVFEISTMDLDRNEIFFEKYKGSHVLIVNIASENQESMKKIEELKEIALKYEGKLNILAFPSNQFGNEPKSFEEIKKVYSDYFKINFPLFAKVEVNGQFTNTLYKFLKRHSPLFKINSYKSEPIQADFCKFLLSNNGTVHKYFDNTASKELIMSEIENIMNSKQGKEESV